LAGADGGDGGGELVEQLIFMMEATNILAGVQGMGTQAATAFNAWNVVALGVGAALTHAYHLVVAAGGLKRMGANFWNGPATGPAAKREERD